MDEKKLKLILTAMCAEYESDGLSKIINLLKEIYETTEVELIQNPKECPSDAKYSEFSYLPIIIDGKMVSCFKIKPKQESFATLWDECFSKILSEMYSNIVKYERIANYDVATNLLNRNAYERFVSDFNSKEYQSLGCVYIDINDLCVINNNHGHKVGDDVIKKVASLLQEAFGNIKGAKIFRTGGDEFVVLIPDVGEQILNDQIESVKKSLVIGVEGTCEEVPISISIGTSIAYSPIDINQVIGEADDNMYKDKKAYHDQVGTSMRKKRCISEEQPSSN